MLLSGIPVIAWTASQKINDVKPHIYEACPVISAMRNADSLEKHLLVIFAMVAFR